MQKRITLIITGYLWVSLSAASGQTERVRSIHVGMLYPISNNGTEAPYYTNQFSFHLLSGISKNENALAISGLANIIRENARGAQISGIVNYVGGNVSGVQIAGIANLAGDSVQGTQIAGFMNKGALVNTQVAGFANLAGPGLSAVQVSGFLNKADEANTQVAGFLNVARKVKGVQLSGFINIADSSDYPIGVLNFIRNGEKGISISIDETLTTTAAFRSGGRVLYSILGIGYQLRYPEDRLLAFESGIGAHWSPAPRFRLKGELVHQVLTDFSGDGRMKGSIRLLPAFKALRQIEIFGGPTINYVRFETDEVRDPFRKYIWEQTHCDTFQGIHIGFVAGIQVLW